MHKKEILLWLTAALILAFVVSPFAASSPDGLEKVAADNGFLEKGETEP
ncbi:MAG: PDGLE domain-containing protein, partial [Candidatus Omnitrophota bacterium]